MKSQKGLESCSSIDGRNTSVRLVLGLLTFSVKFMNSFDGTTLATLTEILVFKAQEKRISSDAIILIMNF